MGRRKSKVCARPGERGILRRLSVPKSISNKCSVVTLIDLVHGVARADRSQRKEKRQQFILEPLTTNAHKALLAMFSPEDGSDPTWRSLTIETYPRNAISDPDDASAEAKMSAWLAHGEDASASSNKSAVVSGQKFSVSVFGVQDGAVRKGAVVWTTIRKGANFCRSSSPPTLHRN